MKPEFFNDFRTLRNQLAHPSDKPDLNEVAQQLKKFGVQISASELPALLPVIHRTFGSRAGLYFVPQILFQVLENLLDSRYSQLICDPWAGIGTVVAGIQNITRVKRILALTPTTDEATLGRVLAEGVEWQVTDSLQALSHLNDEIDVAVSILPIGHRVAKPVRLKTIKGESIESEDNLGNLILVAASQKLSTNGIGLFVVTPSFFSSSRSVFHQFSTLGIGIDAALALPPGTFAPFANISTYLVITRKSPVSRMFVAQLSNDPHTNLQILSNFKYAKEGGSLELGRFVEARLFKSMEDLRIAERFQQAEYQFGSPVIRLEDLATEINLGRQGDNFEFPKRDNAIFIPIIGLSDVVDSLDALTLKRQNYAQIVIDTARSNARFVARFLNSEFGKEIREFNKNGLIIPKLNKQLLKQLQVFIPDLTTQHYMLKIEAGITGEQNTLLSLQNEIEDLRRQLWSNPKSAKDVEQGVQILSSKLRGNLKQHAIERLDQWFETLPFPLASIVRAWQATPSQDFKTKYEHLLHFFEATAEFMSIILLSAFSTKEILFDTHKQKLKEALSQNLSFQRTSFGTWKLTVEYLAKQSRQLLSEGDKKHQDAKNDRTLCADMFRDPSLTLPKMLSQKEVAKILSTANKMRNDWSGHGGVVGQEEAKQRNQLLIQELEKLREVMSDTWSEIQLIQAVHCQPRRGVFENEIAILMGSNSEFLKEKRPMSTWLDVEGLYLSGRGTGQALRLLPLVQVGPLPQSTKNACYFFNRTEKDGLRFVSYHFADRPELKVSLDDATEVMKFIGDM